MTALIQDTAMAKKKAAPKRGRPRADGGPKMHVLGIRGCEEWKEWLSDFAAANRSDMVDLVDDALAAYAKTKGFRTPPKR